MISNWRHRSRQDSNQYNLSRFFLSLELSGGLNGSYYIGLSHDGRRLEFPRVDDRMYYLINNNYLEYDTLLNPNDSEMVLRGTGAPTSALSIAYSYAMLQIDVGFDGNSDSPVIGRRTEWRSTWNSRAALMADRYWTTSDSKAEQSAWSSSGWQGHVLWNSGSVIWHDSPSQSTRYGGVDHGSDHLFQQHSIEDAYLIHIGQ